MGKPIFCVCDGELRYMAAICARSLRAVLAEIPDPRKRQGQRHPHTAMLMAVVCAILSGVRGGDAIAQWVRSLEVKFWHVLGFRRKPPCANTFRDLLGRISPAALEQALRKWITGTLDKPLEEELQSLSLDGKTLCGTLQPHVASIHLLGLLDHQSKCMLSQQAVDSKTNEAKPSVALLETLAVEGRVITGDAMFCQREVCQKIVDSGGDYLIVVKENQPSLKEAIVAEFQPGLSPLQPATAA